MVIRQYYLCNTLIDDLFYVVNHAIEQALDIYLDLASQSKTTQAFVCPDVGKDRLSDGYAPRIDLSPLLGINLAGHSPRKVGELNCNHNP